MTRQELKDRAAHFATKFWGEGEKFTTGDAVDAVMVHLEGASGMKVKVVLNRETGDFLGATGTPAKST